MRRALLLLFFLVPAACTTQIPPNTGIQGEVFIGPVCPVVQLSNPCPDKPYQASLTILTPGGVKVRKISTDSLGQFQVPLAPGNYILRPEPPPNQPMPFGREQPFTVTAGQFTHLKVIYDSGIR